MSSLPTLTDKGTAVLDEAAKVFHAPYTSTAEFPNTAGPVRDILHSVLCKLAATEFGYDDYSTEGPLELLSSDLESEGIRLDVEEVRSANDDFEMESYLLGDTVNPLGFADRWAHERDAAVVLRFYQSVRSGFESVIDMDPGSLSWDPEKAYSQVIAS